MSIAALNQVYDEVRRLMIAGSDLAAGDFRLKKLVEPLRKTGEKAPVFTKVADAVDAVLASTQQTSATTLLDLSSLVTAILYTQGKTGVEGELAALETQDLGLASAKTSARVLKPLIEALTTTGSGRLETIREAHERGAFKDLRLVKHAVAAIDDPYGEVGDFIAKEVLPVYGKSIYAELRRGFDPKGKLGAVRRLERMHKLDPEATHDLVTNALDEGSPEVKVGAIGCLEGRADALDYLLEQAKARKQDVRQAALRALVPMTEARAVALLSDCVTGKNLELVADALGHSPDAGLRQCVLSEASLELDRVLAALGKKGKKEDLDFGRLRLLVRALSGRSDAGAEAFRRRALEQHALLAVAEGVLIDLAESCESPAERALLASFGPHVPALIHYTFRASHTVDGPAETYGRFVAAYRDRPAGRSAAAVASRERAEAIGQEIAHAMREDGDVDPRWLEAALDLDDSELVFALVKYPSPRLHAYLANALETALRAKTLHVWDIEAVLTAMEAAAHPELASLGVAAITAVLTASSSKVVGYYYRHRHLELLERMPPSAIDPLEALVDKLPDDLLADYVEALGELKKKHGRA